MAAKRNGQNSKMRCAGCGLKVKTSLTVTLVSGIYCAECAPAELERLESKLARSTGTPDEAELARHGLRARGRHR